MQKGTGGRRQEAGSRKQEAGSRRQEAGSRKPASRLLQTARQEIMVAWVSTVTVEE